MTFGLHETRLRRRRRIRWAFVKWTIALGVILVAGIFAYQTGSSLAQLDLTRARREVVELTGQVEELRARNTDLRAKLILIERRLADAQARYEKDVPRGRMATLLQKFQDKLDAGVKLDRLEFLVESAQNPRECDAKPVTKRFLVQTPLYRGANDSVGFSGNAVTVTALGETATSAGGQVEAWFDPAKPVTLRLTGLGGETTEKRGKLPLYASTVIGDYEYRYTVIAAGTRGFVQVTGERCRYP